MSRSDDYFGYFSDAEQNVYFGLHDLNPASHRGDVQSVALLEAHDALAATIFVSALASMIGVFPGHHDGGVWPLYIPETHGHRPSQHLFDPYRFIHNKMTHLIEEELLLCLVMS